MTPALRKARWIAGAFALAVAPLIFGVRECAAPAISHYLIVRDSTLIQRSNLESIRAFRPKSIRDTASAISESWIRTSLVTQSIELVSMKASTSRDRISYELALQGDFPALVRWVRLAESPEYPCQVDQFTVSSSDARGGPVKANLIWACLRLSGNP